MRDEYAGAFKMRFVGWGADGKLIKFAPGNYKKNEIRVLPYHYCKKTWWELAEKLPAKARLRVPPGESVFEPDSNFEEFLEVEDEAEELPDQEDAATLAPQISSGVLTKRELIIYIESAGGEAKMSMTKAELQALALNLGYPS